MTTLQINNTDYQLISNYQDNDPLRQQLNELTQRIFGFTFEKWYQKGYWKSNCIPYSLLLNNTIVTHLTLSLIQFRHHNQIVRYLQLGTVLTHETYRHLGLSKALIDYVIHEWEDQCDCIYLYANDEVVHFYPRFGFKETKEYQPTMLIDRKEMSKIRTLNLENKNDLTLFQSILSNRQPCYELAMISNDELILFYCECMNEMEFYHNILYLEEMNTIVIATYENKTLKIHDIFSEQTVDFKQITRILFSPDTQKVIFSFIPHDETGYTFGLVNSENNHLFIRGNHTLMNQKTMFPILSHT